MKKTILSTLLLVGWIFAMNLTLYAKPFYVDLTHRIPTFAPLDGDMNKADLSKPLGNSDRRGIPTFGAQTVFQAAPPFKTGQGYFYGGRLTTSEHHGTHIDAPGHYVNNAATLEIKHPNKKLIHEMTAQDLIGPAVLIDISGRVAAELDKNGGRPHPDPSVTDFSDSSPNVVTAADIQAVTEKITNRAWIVVNMGWSRFYYQADWEKSPYINGWNFPGVSRAALDKIIEIENEKQVRINGFVVDNIGVDTGEASIGPKKDFQNSFYSHVRGLQRGWKMVENANYLGQLSQAKKDSCTITIGAPKHVEGSGGPARVLAICEQ